MTDQSYKNFIGSSCYSITKKVNDAIACIYDVRFNKLYHHLENHIHSTDCVHYTYNDLCTFDKCNNTYGCCTLTRCHMQDLYYMSDKINIDTVLALCYTYNVNFTLLSNNYSIKITDMLTYPLFAWDPIIVSIRSDITYEHITHPYAKIIFNFDYICANENIPLSVFNELAINGYGNIINMYILLLRSDVTSATITEYPLLAWNSVPIDLTTLRDPITTRYIVHKNKCESIAFSLPNKTFVYAPKENKDMLCYMCHLPISWKCDCEDKYY